MNITLLLSKLENYSIKYDVAASYFEQVGFLGLALLLAVLLAIVIYFGSFIVLRSNLYVDKALTYECGFNPFDDARQKFDVRFFLVGMLFIVFDLEILFLYPWVMVADKVLMSSVSIFLFILIIFYGFLYEVKTNAIDWSL